MAFGGCNQHAWIVCLFFLNDWGLTNIDMLPTHHNECNKKLVGKQFASPAPQSDGMKWKW